MKTDQEILDLFWNDNQDPPIYPKQVLSAMEMYRRQLQEENDLLKALVGELVSVDDKIPVNNDKLLITDGVVTKTARRDIDKNKWQISGFKIIPTHWRPLPQPPQK